MATTKPTKPLSVLDIVSEDYAYEIVDHTARNSAKAAAYDANKKVAKFNMANGSKAVPNEGTIDIRGTGFVSVTGNDNIVTIEGDIPIANTEGDYGLTRLSDSVSDNNSNFAATSKAVKTAYDKATSAQSTAESAISKINSFLYRTTKKIENVTIPGDGYSGGYVNLGHMTEFGLDASTDHIISLTVQGWSGGIGTLSLVKSTDGRYIYAMGSYACTFNYVNVEIFYTKLPL